MKSPKVKGIGEVVTEYGARVMKIFKKGLLGRSLFDFYGDVKAQTFRTKESASVPSTPSDGAGGIMYTKSADGKLYYKSNEVAEVELSSHTGLSTEEVQDIAGALVATGGTKTGITVTYQDGTGDMDFVVDHDAASNFVAAEHVDWAGASAGTIHSTNIPTLNQNTTGGAATANVAKNVTGSPDADVSITSDGDVNITIDADGDETDSLVLFKSRAVEIGRIDEVGNATFPGIITGKQRQIYQQSFIDDLGTTKHYLPWRDTDEQTTIYQEEAAMVAPYDGRIVSVTMRCSSLSGSGNRTIGIHTFGPNASQFTTGNWTEEEVEAVAIESTDDNHVFYYVFDNAKHFESGELITLSIQDDSDLTSGSRYTYVSTVVEWDYNNGLGTGASSAEYDAAQ